MRKSLADKSKRDEATAAQRRTLDARRDEQVVAKRELRKAERAAATRQAVHATRVELAKRVETARFAAEAAAKSGTKANAEAGEAKGEEKDGASQAEGEEGTAAFEGSLVPTDFDWMSAPYRDNCAGVPAAAVTRSSTVPTRSSYGRAC